MYQLLVVRFEYGCDEYGYEDIDDDDVDWEEVGAFINGADDGIYDGLVVVGGNG